jgi:hypothetical protein
VIFIPTIAHASHHSSLFSRLNPNNTTRAIDEIVPTLLARLSDCVDKEPAEQREKGEGDAGDEVLHFSHVSSVLALLKSTYAPPNVAANSSYSRQGDDEEDEDEVEEGQLVVEAMREVLGVCNQAALPYLIPELIKVLFVSCPACICFFSRLRNIFRLRLLYYHTY